MEETFWTELHKLIDKYKVDELYGIPTFLLVDWIQMQVENLGTFNDNLDDFNSHVNEALAAVGEDDAEEDVPLDGDAATALASAGWGTDEDYGGGDNERL